MDNPKRYWWVTMSACGHFRTLKIKNRVPEIDETSNEKWQNCIFFDNEADALEFLAKMKEFVKKEYPRSKMQKWYESI